MTDGPIIDASISRLADRNELPRQCRFLSTHKAAADTRRLFLPAKDAVRFVDIVAGGLVPRFQRSNGQILGYQARTFQPPRQRITYPVQALRGSGKAFGCFLSSRGVISASQTRRALEVGEIIAYSRRSDRVLSPL